MSPSCILQQGGQLAGMLSTTHTPGESERAGLLRPDTKGWLVGRAAEGQHRQQDTHSALPPYCSHAVRTYGVVRDTCASTILTARQAERGLCALPAGLLLQLTASSAAASRADVSAKTHRGNRSAAARRSGRSKSFMPHTTSPDLPQLPAARSAVAASLAARAVASSALPIRKLSSMPEASTAAAHTILTTRACQRTSRAIDSYHSATRASIAAVLSYSGVLQQLQPSQPPPPPSPHRAPCIPKSARALISHGGQSRLQHYICSFSGLRVA